MFDKLEDIRRDKIKLNFDTEGMERGYMEMGELSKSIANEMYHLETETTYTLENFIGVDDND